MEIITSSLENIREVISLNLNKFTEQHKEYALEKYWPLRDLLVKVLSKHNICQELSHNINQPIKLDLNNICMASGTPDTIEEESGSEEFESNTVIKQYKMTQTVVDFINTATRLIPDFDGKPENLRSFLDALSLIETLKGSHETVAINLIKTKLKGNARNLIENEATIQDVIGKLKNSVKGESVEVLSAKILNIRQNSKSANSYCNEVETLTKALESAYISDGLSRTLAQQYSTQIAVKAMTRNCTIDRVKLIMEAGQYTNMNEAIGKFVSSCTEATGQQNSILYFGNRSNRNYRGNRGRQHGRGGYRNNGNNNNHNNNGNRNRNGNSNYRGNRRGYNNNNNNRQNNYAQNNNVRTTNAEQTNPEN